MTRPIVDWQRATLVGAVSGGVFWGLAAGAILASKASAAVIALVCVIAAVMVIVGALVYRRSVSLRNRTLGIALVLAPCTGLAPVLTISLPGLLAQAISWKG